MSEFHHQPVMLAEVLSALRPLSGGRYVDATLGGAGHAVAILKASSPTGYLFGLDRDVAALEAARERLAPFAGRFELYPANFRDLGSRVGAGSCDGVLLDLGVSSPQLDVAERGFSFQADGPLDMRMDRRESVTAAMLVNEWDADELERALRELGEEREARRLARGIVAERQQHRFETTRQLAEFVERLVPRRGQRIHPATRVFQALRMAVNDELAALACGLESALTVLRSGGRLAVISFHSGEDRVVKDFGRRGARDYRVLGEVDVPELREPCTPRLRMVVRKPTRPGPEEIRENPRARSAQLRVFEKI